MKDLQPEEIDAKRTLLMQEAVTEVSALLQKAENLEPDVSTATAWITTVFQEAVDVSSATKKEPDPVPEIKLPAELVGLVIKKLMDILGYAFAFEDCGLYYLSDVGAVLGVENSTLRTALDVKFESLREEFSKLLLQELDSTHRHWCAVIILKTILADGVIAPSEKAYFKVINALVSDDPKTPAELVAAAKSIEKIPDLNLDKEIVRILMWHIVAIAMFDGEYVGQEAQFIKETAVALQLDPAKIDDIIQPVAATFMVIQSLFPAT
jgi:antitoxin component HigA of HigAB toxin-antitoxin module